VTSTVEHPLILFSMVIDVQSSPIGLASPRCGGQLRSPDVGTMGAGLRLKLGRLLSPGGENSRETSYIITTRMLSTSRTLERTPTTQAGQTGLFSSFYHHKNNWN
jgi:hypothetical protein